MVIISPHYPSIGTYPFPGFYSYLPLLWLLNWVRAAAAGVVYSPYNCELPSSINYSSENI